MEKPENTMIRFGDILAAIYFKKDVGVDGISSKKPLRFIIVCHGFPGGPSPHIPEYMKTFIEAGYVLVYPHYKGTWGSFGKMTWEGCVDTVLETIAVLKKGKALDVYTAKDTSWKTKEIILAGGSFGGSIVLVAGAKSKDIRKILAVAAPDEYRTRSKSKDFESDYNHLQIGWKNLWRLSRSECRRYAKGQLDLNPIDYVSVLKNKNVFLIHGEDDKVVLPKCSLNMYEDLRLGKGNHKIWVIKKLGHKGADIIGRKDIAPKVLSWLKK